MKVIVSQSITLEDVKELNDFIDKLFHTNFSVVVARGVVVFDDD